MRKFLLVSFIFVLCLFTVSATQFNLPICWVTTSTGVSMDADCDGVLSATNVNLTNYYTISQITLNTN